MGLLDKDIGEALLDELQYVPTDGNFLVGDGSNWVVESGATARTSIGLGTGDSPQFTTASLVTNPAADDTVVEMFKIQRNTTGTAAVGMGSRISFYTELSNGTTPETARIENRWIQKDLDCSLIWYAMSGGTLYRIADFEQQGFYIRNEAAQYGNIHCANVVLYSSALGTSGDQDLISMADNAVTINGTIDSTGTGTFPAVVGGTSLSLTDSLASPNQIQFAVGGPVSETRTISFTIGDASRTITLDGSPTLNDWFDQSVKQAASPTWTGTVDVSGGKILVRDDAASKPTGESDGYISVYESGATRRFYTFIGGQRYYVDLSAEVDIVTGNPQGLWLFWFTYKAA
jgi:hypothetical protein